MTRDPQWRTASDSVARAGPTRLSCFWRSGCRPRCRFRSCRCSSPALCHAGPIELSLFLLAQPLAGVVVSTVLGRLSDGRVARRRLLMVCAAAGCTSAALFSVLRNYWPLLILACTVTAVGGALLPQSFGYARAVLAGEPTAPKLTSTLRTFFSLSWVAGPPLASLLLNAGGFATLYVCSAALYAAVLFIAFRWLTEAPVTRPPTAMEEAAPAPSPDALRGRYGSLS